MSTRRFGGKLRSRGIKALASGLAALLVGSTMLTGIDSAPAAAAEGASIMISKTVDGQKEVRDLRPGDSVTYRVEFIANDEDADGPATVVDVLPEEFAGWEFSGLIATFNSQRTGVTLDVPGVTEGPSPDLPLSGTLPENPADLRITVGVALPVQSGAGNDAGTGVPTGAQGVLEYTLTVPRDMSPDDPRLRKDLTNTATFSAFAGEQPLAVDSSAVIEIDNPASIDVSPAKSWEPAEQNFQPGAASTVKLKATQTSNIGVGTIVLQDPANPDLTPDGATRLAEENPFNFVDFAGFTAPASPLEQLPAGADGASLEVYHFNGSTWNWTEWNRNLDNADIAGVRLSYHSSTASIAPGTVVAQEFQVKQRATHRESTQSLSAGWSATNEVAATVEAPDHSPVSKSAEASFAVTEEQIDVRAQKRFYRLPNGEEVERLTEVTAGDEVGVVLRAINSDAPQSTTLDTLTIAEPGDGSNEEFLGENLVFAGFDSSGEKLDDLWPQGATSATVTWHLGGETIEQKVSAGDPLPEPPSEAVITGFTIEYEGQIAPSAAAQVHYRLKTNPAEDFVGPGETLPNLRNTIDVTGERAGIDPVTANAGATISLVAPGIDVQIEKQVGPGTVMPGQTVVVQLGTEASASGGRTKPVEIIVEDAWEGEVEGTFWDAFDAKQILPPFSLPTNGDGVDTETTLEVYERGANGEWNSSPLVTNPSGDQPIDLNPGITGVRFVYTNADGLSQTTYVKPNISFEARETLRSDPGTPTAESFTQPESYVNTATASVIGELDSRKVTGEDSVEAPVAIRGKENGPESDGDGLWADKAWAHDYLTGQSSAATWSTQRWAVVKPEYERVELQDPSATTETGAGTVFEAFNLTRIRPIYTSGGPGDGTVDPRMKWDRVTDVQLNDGTNWHSVDAPDGGWMNDRGFVGYVLTAEQRQSTVGVRLVIEENSEARKAAQGDLTAPAVGSGVAASADIRTFRLDWELRNTARTADGSLKWVTGNQNFNCDVAGCVTNHFSVTAFPSDGPEVSVEANDSTQLIDGIRNVSLSKTVSPIDADTGQPGPVAGDGLGMTVPNAGELDQADYPQARFTLTARNSSTAQEDARGDLKLGKIRVVDTRGSEQTPEGAQDFDENPFAGRSFSEEVETVGNHFNLFDVTSVSFERLPDSIDTSESTVQLWLYDGESDQGTVAEFTLQQALDRDEEFVAALPNAIGVAVTYSGEDPSQFGNSIRVGEDLVIHLDVQLRETERLSGKAVAGGDFESAIEVTNTGIARGLDAVVDPENQPTDVSQARVLLRQAAVQVGLTKHMSVQHGDRSDRTLLEADPLAPVSVKLTASPNGSTAPINSLRIQDDSAEFWQRFQLVAFDEVTYPADADTAALQVKTTDGWLPYDTFQEQNRDLTEVIGVAVEFTRDAGNGLFPQGATSWNSSWNTAVLPFTVQLREDAVVDWSADEQTENTAVVIAINREFGSERDNADDDVQFAEGSHAIEVVKRAPNDTSTHRIDPLVALPWQLVFTNTGSGYLPIETVTDQLPADLSWDGETPTFEGVAGTSGRTGLTADPDEIGVTLSDDGRSLAFTWPEGQRMEPGETMTIGLGLVLQPLANGQRATNEVIVETGVDRVTCEQPTDFGQRPSAPSAENECSNTNFVQPRAGTVVGAVKTVSGEPGETLGEDLVSGALDTRTGEACAPGSFRPIGSDYTRNPCASYTAVGAKDTWKLEHLNTGSNPLARMVVVDMLPLPGDRMLAGGAARGSTFSPVLVGDDLQSVFRFSGLPDGARVAVDVTTNPAACVGAEPGNSAWVADPSCSDTDLNPANSWIAADEYTGAIEDIAGVRFDIDMSTQPLQPAGNVTIEFETVNRVVETSEHGLTPAIERYETPQFAWNQNGVIAWDEANNRVNLPSAPQRAGVTVKTAPLVISKQVLGEGEAFAPDSFAVDVACTVPSGVESPERVPLDLGDYASLTVPRDGSATIPALPVGADCTVSEAGEVGSHGESGRSIEAASGVTPATDGLSAEVRIREGNGDETLVNLRNTYALSGLIIEKAVLSADQYPVADEKQQAAYGFELNCVANGTSDPIKRSFTLRAGEQHEETGLPEGASCTLTETDTGDAKSTSITVTGDEVEGASRDDIVISAEGSHVLVSNVFDGVPPEKLVNTGANAVAIIAATLLLLALGAAAVFAGARRRGARA